MNPNVGLMLFMFALFFILSQCTNTENFEGTAWFPHSYLRHIRQGIEKFTNLNIWGDNYPKQDCSDIIMDQVESPSFSKLGNENMPCNEEVDGWYFSKKNEPDVQLYNENTNYNCKDRLFLSDYNNISPMDIYYNRAGNANSSYKY